MPSLSLTDHPVIIRTDFSDAPAWERIQHTVQNPAEPFIFNLGFVEAAEFADASLDTLLEALPKSYPHSFMVVADATAMTQAAHPLLVVDLMDSRGRCFRAIPSEIPAIENNLSIGNMDFDEFVEAVGSDGVFCGFP